MSLYLCLGLIIVFLFFIFKKNDKNKMPEELVEEASKISIFSEGTAYSKIYEPVIEELLKQNCPVRYYTMDKKDPILSYDHELLKKDYIGKGDWAFFVLSNLKANILLTTTPNIGTKGYPVRKSPNVKSLIHIWHSLGDFTYASYRKYSLDSFDEILTTGNYMEPQIRHIEKIRNIPAKKITVCGVTYLEKLIKEIPEDFSKPEEPKTVLIAPSWGKKNLFRYYDCNFIKKLHDAGYNIVIRPHPQTVKSEKDFLAEMQEKLKDLPNLTWDIIGQSDKNYLLLSDVMISDTSSVRLDYRLVYDNPVITFDTPLGDLTDYDYYDLQDLLKDSPMDEELGAKVYQEDIDNIVEIVSDCIQNQNAVQLEFLKNKYAANFGHASKIIADYLIQRNAELNH